MSYLDAQGRWGEVEERNAFGLLDDGAESSVIYGRALNLERNNALARSVLERAVENFVGRGIVLRPTTSSAAFNKAVERRQKFYFSGNRLDVRRMLSLDGLVRLGVRSLLRDGDCGYALIKIGGRTQLQFIERGQIDQPPYADATIKDGIEWGSNGQPLAFYIRSYDEYGVITHVRVRWNDFIFLCDHPRGGSTRGISRFAGSFSMFNNLAGWIDATVKTARTQNAQAIIAKSAQPQRMLEGRAGKATETDVDGNQFRTAAPIEGGAINFVSNTDEMIAFQPSAPGANIDQGVTTFGRFLGLNFAMPYDDVFLDYSKSNYSNSRMRRLAMGAAIDIVQQYLKTSLFDRLWPWLVASWVKNGEIVDDNGQQVEPPKDAWEYEWTPSARASNDPLKDAQAWKLLIEMGVEAQQNVAEAMGYDWPTLLATIEKNRAELKKAGIDPAADAAADGEGPADGSLDPRTQVDAYGIGVRAGVVTPQISDEEQLRQVLKLPVMSDEARAAWARDGVRRPITISDPGEGTTAPLGFDGSAGPVTPAPVVLADPKPEPEDREPAEEPDESDDEN